MKCASRRLAKPICEKFKSLKGLFIIESAISLSSYSPLLPLTKEGLILRMLVGGNQLAILMRGRVFKLGTTEKKSTK